MKPTDIPTAERRPVLVTGVTVGFPIGMVLVDRDGDEWTVTGHASDGDVFVDCPAPADPGDQGEGRPRPWTLATVERWFGPLVPKSMVREENAEEDALIAVGQEFRDMYGPDDRSWAPWQVEEYLAALAKVHAEFSPQAGQVAA